MKLNLEIKNGPRNGTVIELPDISETPLQEYPVVLEDEVIQFDLIVRGNFRSAVLELYQHSIPVSFISNSKENPGCVCFTWAPHASYYNTNSKLFWNYFGLAELNILLLDENGEVSELLSFQPIQVAATKSQADKVEEMFDYLAELSPEVLHSIFSATKHSSGLEEGQISPNHAFEKIEHALHALKEIIPEILQNPLTRLVPEYRLTPVNGGEELDDSSIGWLLENTSVLETTDIPEEAHINFEGENYKASALLLPILEEKSDIYENWVVHGYVELLLHQAQSLCNRMEHKMNKRNDSTSIPNGYVSFFEKVTRFKGLLMGTQIHKFDEIINTLKYLKLILERQLPVNRSIHYRPIITTKILNKPAYRNLFYEIIKWHEKGKIDWSSYQNLFAIESIPMLFEAYTYFRVLDITNRFFEHRFSEKSLLKNKFIDKYDNQIEIIREPIYWTVDHKNRDKDSIVNSEGYTLDNRSIRKRGQNGINSKRSPDIVIKIVRPSGLINLIVMDAKYSYADKAFRDYLPALTMKYVHGIHRTGQSSPLINALAILHPDDSALYRDFHQGTFGVFGETPAKPSLACCGIMLGRHRNKDNLERFIRKTLEHEKVRPIKLEIIGSDSKVVA